MHRARKRRAYIAIEGKIRGKMQKRRRGRTTHPLARIAARGGARARQKEALVTVTTYSGCTLIVKGKNGYGYAECV